MYCYITQVIHFMVTCTVLILQEKNEGSQLGHFLRTFIVKYKQSDRGGIRLKREVFAYLFHFVCVMGKNDCICACSWERPGREEKLMVRQRAEKWGEEIESGTHILGMTRSVQEPKKFISATEEACIGLYTLFHTGYNDGSLQNSSENFSFLSKITSQD